MAVTKPVFKVRQTPDSIGFVFSSTMENIDDVCQRATRYLRSSMEGIDAQLFGINLVIREALTNAVLHGNTGDTGKVVRFLLSCIDKESIRLEIEDEGDGFDWKKYQAAELPGDEDHGRGIIIMGAYCNRCSYNEKGNILYLEKDLSC